MCVCERVQELGGRWKGRGRRKTERERQKKRMCVCTCRCVCVCVCTYVCLRARAHVWQLYLILVKGSSVSLLCKGRTKKKSYFVWGQVESCFKRGNGVQHGVRVGPARRKEENARIE